LWLLARRLPGDRAAFFGAVAILLLTWLGISLYVFEVVESNPSTSNLNSEAFNRHLRERVMPPMRVKARPYRYAATVLSGLWIGSMAEHPWLMGGCALLAEIALGGAMDALPRFRLYGTLRVVATLSAAIALGCLIHSWLW
jgi:hypothetical protein